MKTSDCELSYNLLDDDNLRVFDVSLNDIKEVRPIWAIPGYLYEELRVAGPRHRLVGSACASFSTYDGRNYGSARWSGLTDLFLKKAFSVILMI